jgi:polyphosphate kinase
MFRNLSHRVEAATPIEDRSLRERLWEILDVCLRDDRQAWELRSDGTYVQRQPRGEAHEPGTVGTHAWMMEQTRRRAGVS